MSLRLLGFDVKHFTPHGFLFTFKKKKKNLFTSVACTWFYLLVDWEYASVCIINIGNMPPSHMYYQYFASSVHPVGFRIIFKDQVPIDIRGRLSTP